MFAVRLAHHRPGGSNKPGLGRARAEAFACAYRRGGAIARRSIVAGGFLSSASMMLCLQRGRVARCGWSTQEAADRVGLPAGCFHDGGNGRALFARRRVPVQAGYR